MTVACVGLNTFNLDPAAAFGGIQEFGASAVKANGKVCELSTQLAFQPELMELAARALVNESTIGSLLCSTPATGDLETGLIEKLATLDLPESALIERLHRLRSSKLLRGFRGAPAVDVVAVADCLSKIGGLMTMQPNINELA